MTLNIPVHSKSHKLQRRALFVLAPIFGLVMLSLLTTTQLSGFQNAIMTTLGLAGLCGMIFSVLVMTYTHRAKLSGLIFSLSVTSAFAISPFFGLGGYSPFIVFVVVTPLLFGVMVTPRIGIFYTLGLMFYFPVLMTATPDLPMPESHMLVSSKLHLCLILMTSTFAVGAGTAASTLMTGSTLQDLEGETRKASSALMDVEQSQQRFEMFANVASDWLWETDAGGRVTYFGGQAAGRLKRQAKDILGTHFLEFLDLRKADMVALKAALQNVSPYSSIPVRYTDTDGAELIFELSATPIFDKKGDCTGYLGVGKDVTDRIRAENDVRFLAENDKLTGLANRHTFNTRIEEELKADQKQGAALFAIDLDDFKSVNDSYGHHVGDALLVEVAARINSCIRKGDWAARLGGDEFVVMSIGYDPAKWNVDLVADRILAKLSEPYKIEELSLHMSASVGVARYPGDATSARKLTKYADMALYAAKEGGRNQWRAFTPAMEQVASQRKLMENGLRKALANHTLDVWYQPLVNLNGDQVAGFEALARWTDGERGYIPPNVFIDVAEKCGLINELGEYVLRQACGEAASWSENKDGLAPRVSVNISSIQFSDGGLPELVADVLSDTGLAAERLELEITESILMEDIDVAIRMLEALERLGVSVAIDDFGTGYSSLSYLKRFPLSRLKVDRSFIHDLESDESDRTITQTVVKLGESLGLAVIAEGVETEGQRAWLESMGCKEVQGYLFSKPMPAQDIQNYLQGVRALPAQSHAGANLKRA